MIYLSKSRSYKYHARSMVTNERNLVRLWDICYSGTFPSHVTLFLII